MNKIILAFLLLTAVAFGQSYTTVTATVQDPSTQVWSNLTVVATFIPPTSGTGKPINGGLPITDTPQVVYGDASGFFTVTVDDNSKVSPAGSRWNFAICSNTSAPCVNVQLGVSGPTMDISTQVNSTITAPLVNGTTTLPRVYDVNNEGSGGNGSIFWRSSDNTLWGCQTIPGNTCPPAAFIQLNATTLPANLVKWQGNWSALANYNVQDLVFYNFTAWVALIANANSTPAVGNANWQALTIFGTDKQVLFNDGNTLTGSADFVFDKVTKNVTIGGLYIGTGLSSNGAGGMNITANEGSLTCTPASSVECLWADATAHRWKMNNNNAGNRNVVGNTSAGTSGHLTSYDANGIDIIDSTFPASQIGTMQTSINNNTTSITNLTTQVNNLVTGDYVLAGRVTGCGGSCTFNYGHTFTSIHSCVCSGEGGSCNISSFTTSSCTINTTVANNDVIVSGVF